MKNIFDKLQEFADEQDFESEEEALKAIEMYLNNIMLTEEEYELDEYAYLAKAIESTDSEIRMDFIKKSLEINPDFVEAKLFLLMNNDIEDPEKLQLNIEKILNEEEQRLKQEGITEEECIGKYYEIDESQGYIRAYETYIRCLIVQGKMRKAAKACRKVCRLDEDDNLELRYSLIAIYAFLEEEKMAEDLYKKYSEESSRMLLPMIALYYKLGDEEKAISYLKILHKKTKGLRQAVKILKEDIDKIEYIMSLPICKPNSKEDIIRSFMEASFVYETIPNFLNWMEELIPTKKVPKKKKNK